MWSQHDIDEDLCVSTLVSYISEHSNSYPCLVGEDFSAELKDQMVLFLVSHLSVVNSFMGGVKTAVSVIILGQLSIDCFLCTIRVLGSARRLWTNFYNGIFHQT